MGDTELWSLLLWQTFPLPPAPGNRHSILHSHELGCVIYFVPERSAIPCLEELFIS